MACHVLRVVVVLVCCHAVAFLEVLLRAFIELVLSVVGSLVSLPPIKNLVGFHTDWAGN
jgi:hypothetical protein